MRGSHTLDRRTAARLQFRNQTHTRLERLEARHFLSAAAVAAASPYLTYNAAQKSVVANGFANGSNSADVFTTSIVNTTTLRVSVDIGADALSAYELDAPLANVNVVSIFGGDGNDTIIHGGGMSVQIDAGDGDDAIFASRIVRTGITAVSGTAGAGDDVIRYGSLDAETPGSLDDFQAVPSLSGGAGDDTLIFDDRGAGHAVAYTIDTFGQVVRPGTRFTLAGDPERTELLASNVASTFAIQGVSNLRPLTIRGGDGDDQFILGDSADRLTSFKMPLLLDGGGGVDVATFRDDDNTTAASYVIANGLFSRTGIADVTFSAIEDLSVIASNTAADAFDVTAAAGTRITIGDSASTVPAAGLDTLLLRAAASTHAKHSATGANAGTWTFTGAADVRYANVATVRSARLVDSMTLLDETLPIRLRYVFADDVGGSLSTDDLRVTDASGHEIPVSAVSWDAASLSGTFTLGGGVSADGIYIATLAATGFSAGVVILDALRVDTFSLLAGDANGDRVVNFADLVVLAQNYNKRGQTLSQGNFDYSADGLVDFNDLVVLAQRYNAALTMPLIAPALVAATPAVAPKKEKRIVTTV